MHKFLILLFFIPFVSWSSESDSALVDTSSCHHTWKKAAIWSACLPGSGQIYNEFGYRCVQGKKNRAWWKAPVIYGAMGAVGYYFYQNLTLARGLKDEYIFRENHPGQLLYPEYYDWTSQQLLDGKIVNGYSQLGFDAASKQRDMLGFGFIAIWGLQVVEALVDGHFVSFDVSEDLSFNWSPVIYNRQAAGLNLVLQF